jgi:hypothetical protein
LNRKQVFLIIIIILVYTGPYVFVYGRSATWTYPKIDDKDDKAFETVAPFLSDSAGLKNIVQLNGANEANYSMGVGLLNRKFLDWIGFPLVLDIQNFNFKASGIYQDKILLECAHFEAQFPKPTGSEPWYIYQPLVDKNNNTILNVSCYGDASVINNASSPIPLTLYWSMSALLVGDKNEKERSWSGTIGNMYIDTRRLQA